MAELFRGILTRALPVNPKMVKKNMKPALIPAFSPWEKEKRLPSPRQVPWLDWPDRPANIPNRECGKSPPWGRGLKCGRASIPTSIPDIQK
jgi:hypothetical protein